ncbi:unnamed protein product, partial [Sphagnum balticum]
QQAYAQHIQQHEMALQQQQQMQMIQAAHMAAMTGQQPQPQGQQNPMDAQEHIPKAEQANKEKLLTQQGQQNQENTRLKSQLEQEQQEANLAKASDL